MYTYKFVELTESLNETELEQGNTFKQSPAGKEAAKPRAILWPSSGHLNTDEHTTLIYTHLHLWHSIGSHFPDCGRLERK